MTFATVPIRLAFLTGDAFPMLGRGVRPIVALARPVVLALTMARARKTRVARTIVAGPLRIFGAGAHRLLFATDLVYFHRTTTMARTSRRIRLVAWAHMLAAVADVMQFTRARRDAQCRETARAVSRTRAVIDGSAREFAISAVIPGGAHALQFSTDRTTDTAVLWTCDARGLARQCTLFAAQCVKPAVVTFARARLAARAMTVTRVAHATARRNFATNRV